MRRCWGRTWRLLGGRSLGLGRGGERRHGLWAALATPCPGRRSAGRKRNRLVLRCRSREFAGRGSTGGGYGVLGTAGICDIGGGTYYRTTRPLLLALVASISQSTRFGIRPASMKYAAKRVVSGLLLSVNCRKTLTKKERALSKRETLVKWVRTGSP